MVRGSLTWIDGSMKGKVSEQAILKEGWGLVRGSLTWKQEGKGFRTRCLKRRVELVQGFTYMES